MRNMIPNRKEKGFTLIELVMVIVILGILAAFALPRFADLGSDAEKASVNGARGAVQSASAIVRSTFLAGNASIDNTDTANPVTTVTLEGVDITITGGYAAASSIKDAAQLSNEFSITGVDSASDTGIATITQGDCSFDYIEVGSGVDTNADNTAPIITDVEC